MSSEDEKPASFSPHKRKSGKMCAVFGCGNQAEKCPDLRFHTFPKKNEGFVKIVNIFGKFEQVDRLKAWLIALRFGNKLKKHMVVCSKHFKKDDYYLPGDYVYVFCY